MTGECGGRVDRDQRDSQTRPRAGTPGGGGSETPTALATHRRHCRDRLARRSGALVRGLGSEAPIERRASQPSPERSTPCWPLTSQSTVEGYRKLQLGSKHGSRGLAGSSPTRTWNPLQARSGIITARLPQILARYLDEAFGKTEPISEPTERPIQTGRPAKTIETASRSSAEYMGLLPSTPK